MIDLIRKSLPNTVTVSGRDFSIYTDYRVWMKFCIEFRKWKAGGMRETLDIRYLFKNDVPVFYDAYDYTKILQFAFPPAVVPHSDHGSEETVLYYEYDGDYIYSAFLQQYGIDLLDTEMHWHKFLALLNGISSSTVLSDIMRYRSYTGGNRKSTDEQYRELKEAWTPVQELTYEDKIAMERFNEYFKS